MESKLVVIVEFSDNNLSAYVRDIDGIAVTGKNIKEIKESIKEAIDLYIEASKEMELELPDVLKCEYRLVYKYDLCSFLNAYSSVLGKAALENLTGINQKQLWHYASGKRKPSKQTLEKVANSIHEFAKELSESQFA